jgi:uncharacterized protein DUF998
MTVVLGVLGALATVACIAALVRVHLLPTGYRPLANAVSDYGVGPYSRYYRWQTAASAYAALFVAAALARDEHPVPQLPVFLLLVFATARLAIPSYPTDLDRSRPTGTGRAHILLAAAAFASIAWAAGVLPDRVEWLHGLLVGLGWAVIATAIASGILMLGPLQRVAGRYFGAVERLFYAAFLAWLLVVSLHFA